MNPSTAQGATYGLRTWRLSTFGEETDLTVLIASTATDSGAPHANMLRAGLLLGKITASGKYAQYDPDAEDGTETAVGILTNDTIIANLAGTKVDTGAVMAVTAEFDISRVIGWDAAAKADFELDTFNGKMIPRGATLP